MRPRRRRRRYYNDKTAVFTLGVTSGSGGAAVITGSFTPETIPIHGPRLNQHGATDTGRLRDGIVWPQAVAGRYGAPVWDGTGVMVSYQMGRLEVVD